MTSLEENNKGRKLPEVYLNSWMLHWTMFTTSYLQILSLQ